MDFYKITVPPHFPRFIHQDFSYSGDGDATGIAMSCISGWVEKHVENPDGTFRIEKAPAVVTDFALRIKGRPGDKIPLHLIRKFYLDLRAVHGFNIRECTFDMRVATESDKQILERAGITCDYLSMDKDPQKYREFRNVVVEKRWSTPMHHYLFFELLNLEEDPEKNMIDHPEEVATVEFLEDGEVREVVWKCSKDISDAVSGSVTNAIEHSEMPPDQELMKKLLTRTPVQHLPMDAKVLRLAGVEKKSKEETQAEAVPTQAIK